MAKIVITLEDDGGDARVKQTVDVQGFDVARPDIKNSDLTPALLIGGVMLQVARRLADQDPSEVPANRSIN